MERSLGDHLRQFAFAVGIPSGAKARAFIARFDVRAEARTLHLKPDDHMRKFTFAAGIPSGAKARGFVARFDVRAEARTLHLKPVPFKTATNS